MHVCVLGGGLAGTLLAWRLCGEPYGCEVDLFAGPSVPDATAASVGAVRAYETDPRQRALATESLVELLNSGVLRLWSGYRRVPSTYLRSFVDPAEIAGIEAVLPGSAHLADVRELTAAGFAGLGPDTVAVVERESGYVDPHALRHAVLGELARNPWFRLRTELARPGGDARVAVHGTTLTYDALVLATGAWTPGLVGAADVVDAYRVEAIQYALHPASGTLPTVFVDEATGLYGRPAGPDTMLLGVPVSAHGGPPTGGPVELRLTERAVTLAAHRLPGLRLGPPTRIVRGAGCCTEPPILQLRHVPGRAGVHTFTGGSGASVTTVLTASRIAAHDITAPTHEVTTLPWSNPSR